MDKKNKAQSTKDANVYPGVATDVADQEKTTKKLVKEDVCDLNCNPRNNDIDE